MSFQGRKPLVVFGNCQGEPIANFLADLVQRGLLDAIYEVFYFRNFLNRETTLNGLDFAVLKSASIVILQVNEIEEFPFILENTDPRAEIIRFVYPHCSSLWPLHHAKDPRNVPSPGVEGKYPYGDRLVLQLMRKGLSSNDIFDIYFQTDLRTLIDLDRVYEIDLAAFKKMDRQADFPVCKFFNDSFREQRLFWTNNHPSVEFLSFLLMGICEFLANLSVVEKRGFHLIDEPLGYVQTPIHPQVIDHFGLKFVDKDTRYRHFDAGSFTFSEYIRNYIEWK